MITNCIFLSESFNFIQFRNEHEHMPTHWPTHMIIWSVYCNWLTTQLDTSSWAFAVNFGQYSTKHWKKQISASAMNSKISFTICQKKMRLNSIQRMYFISNFQDRNFTEIQLVFQLQFWLFLYLKARRCQFAINYEVRRFQKNQFTMVTS